jgi:hypothetical protein
MYVAEEKFVLTGKQLFEVDMALLLLQEMLRPGGFEYKQTQQVRDVLMEINGGTSPATDW